MTTTRHPDYPRLFEGPSALAAGTEPTWFCAGSDVPVGCERRSRPGGTWVETLRSSDADSLRWYQVRNVPAPKLPDPEGWHQPDGSIVTLVKHLRGRRDLAEWAYVTQTGHWNDSKGGYRALADIVGDEGTLNADIGERGIHIRRVS